MASTASDSTDSLVVEPINLSLMNFVSSSTSNCLSSAMNHIGQSSNNNYHSDRKAFSCATPVSTGELLPHEERLQKRSDLLQLFEIEPALSSVGGDLVRHSTSALFSQRVQCRVEDYIDDYLSRISQQVRIPRYSHKILPKLPPTQPSTSSTTTPNENTNPIETTTSSNNEKNKIDMDDDFKSAANTDKRVTMDLLTYLQNKETYETTNANRNKQATRGTHQSSSSFGAAAALGKFSRPKAPTRMKEERMSAIITDTSFLNTTYSCDISTSSNKPVEQSPSRKKLSIFGKPSPPPIPQKETVFSTPTKMDPAQDEKTKSPPTIEATLSGNSQHSFSPIRRIARERIVGPHVADFVCDLTYPNFQNASVVHLAAKYNHVDILQWLLECCCDHDCSKDSPTGETAEHSKKCKQRQAKLWVLQDKQEMTPLFYGVGGNDLGEKAHDACVFLCSQPSVQEKQLNFIPDQYGNLPIVLALKRKDYELCDMLQLFGAKLDITVGVGILGESLLHGAFRDCNMDMSQYICKYMPRLLLKKNQREEHALFACLRDYRTINTHSSNSSSNLLDLTEKKTRVERRMSNLVVINKNTSGKYYLFLKDILSNGTTLFGTELFEKALLMKNSFGYNVLMQAVCFNDVDCVKTICKFLFEYTLKNPDKFKFVSSMVFDRDKEGKTIFHISMDFAVRMMSKKPDDFLPWLNGFEWLMTWLEQNFLCHPGNDIVVKTPLTLYNFLSIKDNSGKTAFDIISTMDFTRSEWATIKDCLTQATDKWQKEKSISGSASSLVFDMGEKQGLVAILKSKFKRNK